MFQTAVDAQGGQVVCPGDAVARDDHVLALLHGLASEPQPAHHRQCGTQHEEYLGGVEQGIGGLHHLSAGVLAEVDDVRFEHAAADRAGRVGEPGHALNLRVAVGGGAGSLRQVAEPGSDLRVQFQQPDLQLGATGESSAAQTDDAGQVAVQIDDRRGARRLVEPVDVLRDDPGQWGVAAEYCQGQMRETGAGRLEPVPTHRRTHPVAATTEVAAGELLEGHGGTRHGVAAAVVGQARAGGHARAGEHDGGAAAEQVEGRGQVGVG